MRRVWVFEGIIWGYSEPRNKARMWAVKRQAQAKRRVVVWLLCFGMGFVL